MPTTRPRHVVTESDELAAALDRAAKRWPALARSRGQLLARLAQEGDRLLQAQARTPEERRKALAETAGSFPGLWPPGWREELRDEWPP